MFSKELSTSVPRSMTSSTRLSSSCWKVSRGIRTYTPLAEAACDIVFRLFPIRVREHLLRLVELPELARVAHVLDVEEARVVRDAGGLLHVVRHDHYRVALLQVGHGVLDLLGRYGIEGARRL